MRITRAVLLGCTLITGVAGAQSRNPIEVGTSLGVAILSGGGSSITYVGVPGMGILGQPTIYATFPRGSMLIEPQVALNIISSDGETFTTTGLAGQLGYAFKGTEVNSAYLAGSGAFQSWSGDGESESDFGFGAAVGYRILVGNSAVVRFEGRFRRWFDSEANEFAFGMGIAARLR